MTVFTKNRERFLHSDVAQEWLKSIVLEARQQKLLDEEHFSVDGTLIQAWASERSRTRIFTAWQEAVAWPAMSEGTLSKDV